MQVVNYVPNFKPVFLNLLIAKKTDSKLTLRNIEKTHLLIFSDKILTLKGYNFEKVYSNRTTIVWTSRFLETTAKVCGDPSDIRYRILNWTEL